MSYLFTPKTAFIVTRKGEQRGKLYFTNHGIRWHPGSWVHTKIMSSRWYNPYQCPFSQRNETFLVWLPTFYYHHKDPYRIAGNQKVELIILPATYITEGYYTDMRLIPDQGTVRLSGGHIYLGEL